MRASLCLWAAAVHAVYLVCLCPQGLHADRVPFVPKSEDYTQPDPIPGQQPLEQQPTPLEQTGLPFTKRNPTLTDNTEDDLSGYRLYRSILKSRWPEAWHEDLPCSKPSHSGLVPKMGTGSQSPTLLRPMQLKLYVDEEFPVYAGCMVYISNRFRFIYIRQPKSSSTAVLKGVSALCHQVTNSTRCAEEDKLHMVKSIKEIDDETWNDYFVFTFIRNPWTRMLSAYKMFTKGFLKKRTGAAGEPGDMCGLPWNDFAQNTNNMRKLCPEDDCCAYISGKLQQFRPAFVNVHISDQSHCVFLPGGESMVDFIGTTESLDTDWPAVIDEINRRSGGQLEAKQLSNPNRRDKSAGMTNKCDQADVRSLFNESTMYGIGAQHARDIIKFGYLR